MKLHFMGIGGSGISGVAKLAQKMGHEVTGCDLESDTAYSKNIFKGHDASHIKNADLVIISPAVLFQNKNNPEIKEAKKRKILVTWQEFLGGTLLKNNKLICIAGTHGKSTTTAMAGKLLIDNGFDPIVVLGANVPEWEGNSRFGKGGYAVVEADEFNNNFLHYHPEVAIINNIEFDHPDFFKNEGEVKESFSKFIKNLVGKKILITEKDSLGRRFDLKVPGTHNQKNANMVFLLGKALGIDEKKIIKSIEGFTGIGRRLELIGERNGVKVYDDYAHHPTAIAATLQGLREKYPKARILAIHEPHGYKRTKALLANYKNVFKDADGVMIGPIFAARDETDESINPKLVAKISNHKNISGFDNFDEIIGKWKLESENYDVAIVMGAGKSYLWARNILTDNENKAFKDLTTFRVGGRIRFYKEVENKDDLASAVRFANEKFLPIFIIGEGSDILVSDKKFNGVVIKFTGSDYHTKNAGETVFINAEAGMSWDSLVKIAVDKDIQGIECLSGIPGTVGAAPIQNIGAYGQEIKNVFVKLRAFDTKKGHFLNFDSEDCGFGYRESVFKSEKYWQKYVITDITIKLNRNRAPEIKYESLKNYLIEKDIKNPNLKEVREAVLAIRETKFESPKKVGNAGSFFKNPIVNKFEGEKLINSYPNIPMRKQEDGNYKTSAGWFIEKAGWKGKTYKGAGVSPRHALILINPEGAAKADDLVDLSNMIIKDVKKKFGIKLEREVQLINF